MTHDKLKKGLVERIARMGSHRHALGAAREQLVTRAKQQLDSIGPVIEELSRAAEEDVGGIYTHRRLQTLLDERERLTRVIANQEERANAAPGTKP